MIVFSQTVAILRQKEIFPLKTTAKRRLRKWFSVRAAALTFLCTLLIVYGVCVYIFQDFVFLDKPGHDAPSEKVALLAPTDTNTPMLTRFPHREGPADPLADTYRAVVSDEKSLGCAGTTDGYVRVSYDVFGTQSEAESLLQSAGLSYTIVETYASVPAGYVQSITYAGFSTEDSLWCNPDVPVTLHVSGRKPTASDPEKKIYITFDDGPSEYTDTILRTLARYGARATFFTLGKNIDKYPEEAKNIQKWGSILASHGYSHDYDAIYASTDALQNDLAMWETAVQNAGAWDGVQAFPAFRFPGGSKSRYFDTAQRQAMFDMLHGRGYSVYDWNVLTNDGLLFQCPDGMPILTYLKETFDETWATSAKTKVILMHGSQSYTAELLPYVLRYCVSQGYTFATLDEMGEEYHY